jgi:hypothetical protein
MTMQDIAVMLAFYNVSVNFDNQESLFNNAGSSKLETKAGETEMKSPVSFLR